MKVVSNLIKDIRRHYAETLQHLYDEREANSIIMLLLEHFFGYDKVTLAMNPELRLSESELLTFHFAVKELLKHRPVQYIIGETEFCEMTIKVNENVLIPRPETEEMTRQIIKACSRQRHYDIIDLCCGSGCIGIALAKHLSDCNVTGIDISEKAIATACNNASINNVEVKFLTDDVMSPSDIVTSRQYDIIVSNPPYVRISEKKSMHKNVLDHEPHSALFVEDSEPLIFYESILKNFASTLKTGGMLWFEINEAFGKEVVSLCNQNGFRNTECIKDINGRDRFVKSIKE